MKKEKRITLTVDREFEEMISKFLRKTKKATGVPIQHTVTNILASAIKDREFFSSQN